MSAGNSEYQGYLNGCQSADKLIHIISSRQHYAFNLAWLKTAPPPLRYPPVKVKPLVETFSGPDDFDCEGWADYHAYKGGFDGKGQYTINALGPLGGLNRIVGEGSFEATIEIENIFFYPTLQQNPPGFTLWLRDDRVRKLLLHLKKYQIALRLNDEQSELPEIESEDKIRYSAPPKSLNLKLVYNKDTRRIRIFYGFDGEQATIELPESKAGIYFGEALTESTTIYLMFSSGSMDINHFEIKPI